MNSDVPPDVFKLVERLEGGGVPHEQAKVLADVISAERKWADARHLPRDDIANELLPFKTSIDKVDAKVDRLEMKIDKSAAEVSAKVNRLEMKIDKSAAEVNAKVNRLEMKIDKSAAEVNAKVDRLEMRIDKSAAEVKIEIMGWTVGLWFLQVGFVTALVFKLIG